MEKKTENKITDVVAIYPAPKEIENLTRPLKEKGFAGNSYLRFWEYEYTYIKITDEKTGVEYDAILAYKGAENGNQYNTTAYGWLGDFTADVDKIIIKLYNGDAWVPTSYRVVDYEKAKKAGLKMKLYNKETGEFV